jgi:general secretion pathway protein I
LKAYSYFDLKRKARGFTLLEVMIAMAMIAIALTAVLQSQSQSMSIASEAKFSTTAALLAQNKMAEIEAKISPGLYSDSGDFGEDFQGYTWKLSIQDVVFDRLENASDLFKKIDLTVSWGEEALYQYHLRRYQFFPDNE